MPKHVLRLILLLVGLGVVAVAARNFLVDRSFYQYGHYRGDAVAEIARDRPKFQGVAYCQSCHAAQFAQWSKGVHDGADIGKVVKCEVCHGPGGGRDPQQDYINAATGPIHPDNLKLAIPTDTRALCTLCHERMPGRPPQQAQIAVEDHAGTQQCTLCHNPHSPRTFVGSFAAPEHPGDAAAGKAKAEMCAGCHGAEGVGADLPGPTLAGQSEAYLAAALEAYKRGARSNPMMSPIAVDLGDRDIQDIAAYFASLKCEGPPSAAERVALARKAGASVCADCHGANGVSPDRSAPNLLGQSKDYLSAALKAYASGARSHVVMSALAKGVSDANAEKLAAYYAGASCK
jgi:cytochrome c553